MATRERAAKKVQEETTSNVAEMKKPRARAGAVEKDEAPAKRTRAAEKTEAPAKKAAFGKVPRATFNVPKRRKAPVDNNNEAVALLVTAALNANPDSEGVSAGKLNLLLMGAGLAASSAEAVVLVAAAQKAGVIVGE